MLQMTRLMLYLADDQVDVVSAERTPPAPLNGGATLCTFDFHRVPRLYPISTTIISLTTHIAHKDRCLPPEGRHPPITVQATLE